MASKKRVSLKDIAQAAGVSTSLVSIVLNGKAKKHRVSDAVAERIHLIAAELGYKPNVAARSLRDGRSKAIGVVVSDIANPFFANVARQIEATAEKYDYIVQFSSSDENAGRSASLVDNMLCRNMDGIILVPCEGSSENVRSLVSNGTPLVLFDRKIPDVNCSYVCLDNRKASYDLASHLIQQGYRKIGVVAYNLDLQHMKDRIEGARQAMRDAGMESGFQMRVVDHFDMKKSCERAVRQMVEGGADSLLFASNNIAMECLAAINEKGLKVPDELALVTFDGGPMFDFFYAPFTYLEQPVEIMAQKAAEVLIEQIENDGQMIQKIEMAGRIVARQSSARRKD
ncbi:MAG: substrate-binding domain-containing protein [Bacteroidales bacterium]|nr:substrate-binding domain-containing protein [Bacteroidales bacterium]